MTVTAIQTQAPVALAPMFSPEQEKMILSTFLGGASKDEAVVLLEIVKRRRLDPFSKQVYFVKRYDHAKGEQVWAIQTSIDGLRSIADRTGSYEGQTAPQWCGTDGVWRDVWLEKTPPAAARVGAYKHGFREPAYGVARYDAYVQTKKDGTPTSFWLKMPDLMLAKCAEALAIRKAFPEDTSGLYVPEEMGDSTPAPAAHEAPASLPAPVTVAAVEVKPEPAPPPPPKKSGPPDYVLKLWGRIVERQAGNKTLAQADLKHAAEAVFGEPPKPSSEWTVDDCKKVEAAIFADDVPF